MRNNVQFQRTIPFHISAIIAARGSNSSNTIYLFFERNSSTNLNNLLFDPLEISSTTIQLKCVVNSRT